MHIARKPIVNTTLTAAQKRIYDKLTPGRKAAFKKAVTSPRYLTGGPGVRAGITRAFNG